MAKPIKLFQENTFVILSTMLGGITGSWPGAIVGRIVGLVLDNTINTYNK